METDSEMVLDRSCAVSTVSEAWVPQMMNKLSKCLIASTVLYLAGPGLHLHLRSDRSVHYLPEKLWNDC
jgi:hypothetical protein